MNIQNVQNTRGNKIKEFFNTEVLTIIMRLNVRENDQTTRRWQTNKQTNKQTHNFFVRTSILFKTWRGGSS